MKTVFSLPDGNRLGGALLFSRRLAGEITEGVCALREPGTLWNPGRAVVRGVADRYEALGPAVYVPNWGRGTFAACAMLSSRRPDRCRVIGFCHSDEAHYYQLLTHYESMVHRFVAVSSLTRERLEALIPNRIDHILERPYRLGAQARRTAERLPRRRSYAQWFEALTDRIWAEPPRPWTHRSPMTPRVGQKARDFCASLARRFPSFR